MNPPVITLLTDFGCTDSYVGQMKGAILSVCPQATLVDLTHEIPPQDIARASAVLAEAAAVFPVQTVHLAVVDPGVGSSRRILAAEFAGCRVVAPDNGLLTGLLRQQQLVRTVEVTDPRWWRSTPSSTFHGRDIMGPVAAHWSLGLDAANFGRVLNERPMELRKSSAVCVAAGAVSGQVETVDHFGNLLTNITRDDLRAAGIGEADHPLVQVTTETETGHVRLQGLFPSYSSTPPGAAVALLSSGNCLEIAVRDGSASQLLFAAKNSMVHVRLIPADDSSAGSTPDDR